MCIYTHLSTYLARLDVADGRLEVHVAVRLDDAGRRPRLHLPYLFFFGGVGVGVCEVMLWGRVGGWCSGLVYIYTRQRVNACVHGW